MKLTWNLGGLAEKHRGPMASHTKGHHKYENGRFPGSKHWKLEIRNM